MVLLEGLDVSNLESGKALANNEHQKTGSVDPKTGAVVGFSTYLGSVREVKKIFKASDCDNDRQKYYWEQIKLPFLYGVVELFDEEDHTNAKDLAAMIKYYNKKDEPLAIGYSIDGDIIEKTPNGLIKHAIAKQVRYHRKAL